MQVKNIAIVLALSSVFAGSAMAQQVVRDGSYVSASGNYSSAPAYTPSTVSRSSVAAQAPAAVRAAIADPIAAEGLRSDTQVAAAQRSREAVRAEALQASRQAYASSAQANEGFATLL